jgi:TolA-binding protein
MTAILEEHMNTSLVACALTLLLLTSFGQSQEGAAPTGAKETAQGAVEQELIALDKQFDEARRKGDTKFVEEFLTDDFFRVTGAPLGVQTKAAVLKLMATQATQPAPPPVPEALAPTSYTVHVHGDTALMTHVHQAHDADPGNVVMHVFLKQQGRWKMASSSTTQGQPNTEQSINTAGYRLMEDGKLQDAIELLKTNVRLFPESWNTYDSLGEAYAKAGETALAIQNYEKAIQLNPKHEHAKDALAKLRAK